MTERSCLLTLTCSIALAASVVVGRAAGLEVEGLRCEYRANPLGIAAPQPRLSWRLEASERGPRQTAYRVLAATGT